ncbi:MAG: FG-GAP repeat domain-containing protein [bacterium]
MSASFRLRTQSLPAFILFLCVISTTIHASTQFREISNKAGFKYYPDIGEKNVPPLARNIFDNQGLYAADINNDNWTDLLAIGGKHPSLFINEEGTFRRVNPFGQLADTKVNGALFVDVNHDEWTDLVMVPQRGSPVVYENKQGTLRFRRKLKSVTLDAGIGATAADYNGDGCVDIYLYQYGPWRQRKPRRGQRYRLGKSLEFRDDNGLPNYLLTGDCETLTESRLLNGDQAHWSLAASSVDFNGDGLIDIHVANDFYYDSLYLNQGDGHFQYRRMDEVTDRNGMASEPVYFNNDGKVDLFVSNIRKVFDQPYLKSDYINNIFTSKAYGSNLLINRGDGVFEDLSDTYGLTGYGWAWSVSIRDFDFDQDLEVIQAQQDFSDSRRVLGLNRKQLGLIKDFRVPESLSVNDDQFVRLLMLAGIPSFWDKHNGNRYNALDPRNSGITIRDARGLISLDYDRDGDLDLAAISYTDPYRLFENKLCDRRECEWLRLRVPKAVTVGGQVTAKIGERTIRQPLSDQSDYRSQESPFYHLGASGPDTIRNITVEWNNGRRTRVNDPPDSGVLRIPYPDEP